MVKTKKLNSFNLIKSKLDNEFKYIHIVYFFIKSQSNIENCIDMLEYIKNKNIERVKKNKNKIPILFVKNGEDLEKGGNGSAFFQQLKNELKKHNLIELYDDCLNKKEETEITEDDFLNEEETIEDDYKKYVDGNIIQVHIPTGKNMNKIFTSTKDYILKNNELLVGDKLSNTFTNMENNASQLISFFIKEKLNKTSLSKEEKELYDKLYKECNEFSTMLKNSCSILYSLDILNVKSIKEMITVGVVGTLINAVLGGLWIFTFGVTLVLAAFVIVGVRLIAKKNMIGNIAIKYGFGEQDIINYGLEEYIYGSENNNENFEEKNEKKVKKLFTQLIYYIGPIQCAIKTKESMNQILDLIEMLCNKKDEDWNNFKVGKI